MNGLCTPRKDPYYTVEVGGWIVVLRKEISMFTSLHLNLGAIVLHFDRDQTTAAVPFRSVDEGPGRERKGMKRKQGQLK